MVLAEKFFKKAIGFSLSLAVIMHQTLVSLRTVFPSITCVLAPVFTTLPTPLSSRPGLLEFVTLI